MLFAETNVLHMAQVFFSYTPMNQNLKFEGNHQGASNPDGNYQTASDKSEASKLVNYKVSQNKWCHWK